MKTLFNKKLGGVLAGASALGLTSAANAAFDASAVVTEIAASTAPALLVGGAVIVAMAAIFVFKLIRRAM